LTLDQFFWVLGRVAGLSCFAALSISLVTGVALRSGLFGGLAKNRSLKSTHEFTAVLWIPLGMLHVASLVLDQTARVSLLDLMVPFLANYDAAGRLALGLGTIGFDLFVVVAVTGWLKSRMGPRTWIWVHRLAYLAFASMFLHAVLGGTDFSSPLVSALTWSTAFALVVLTLGRVLWGRLPARTG
jgi:DMSO/TMAO reductase YedYZ heme-binding membrane subunit